MGERNFDLQYVSISLENEGLLHFSVKTDDYCLHVLAALFDRLEYIELGKVILSL